MCAAERHLSTTVDSNLNVHNNKIALGRRELLTGGLLLKAGCSTNDAALASKTNTHPCPFASDVQLASSMSRSCRVRRA
jgi:hypothetical protein